MPNVSVSLDSTVDWNKVSPIYYYPAVIPVPPISGSPRYEAEFNKQAAETYAYQYATSLTAVVPVSAKTTPEQFSFVLGNASLDDVHIVLIRSDVAQVKVEFFKADATSLGSVTVDAGEDYVWITDDASRDSPAWFSDGSGTVSYVKITRYDFQPGNITVYIDCCSASTTSNGLLANVTHYYKFEETTGNFVDAKGGSSIAAQGSPTYSQTGKNNNAVRFSTASDYGDLPTGYNPIGRGQVGVSSTMDFWVKFNSNPVEGYILDIEYDNFGTPFYWLKLHFNATTSKWYLEANNGVSIQIGGTGVSGGLPTTADANFYHIAITNHSTSGVKVYINGTQIGTGYADPNWDSPFYFPTFARLAKDMDVTIDELGLWDEELSATKISTRQSTFYDDFS